jgi:DNA-binding NtrC family response regulator
VLLVGNDRRFRSVAAALLTRRGCTVTVAERTADTSRVAKREAVDVVVIDAGSSLAEATREAARVQIVNRAVSVLLVGEHCDERPSATRLLPKWGSIDELYGAIESARPNANRRSTNGER